MHEDGKKMNKSKALKLVAILLMLVAVIVLAFTVNNGGAKTGCGDCEGYGVILEEGAPEEIFTNPKHERTRQFLQSVL